MKTSEKVLNNNDRHSYYPLDKIYFGNVEGTDCIICELVQNHKSIYIELISLPDFSFIDRVLGNNFKLYKSLKEEIKENNINVCLLLKDGKEKRNLSLEEIINIIKLINLLGSKSFDKLNDLCNNVANQISDLLGINVYSNPSSNLRIKEIDEIIIPATKALKFKNLLFNYIKISLILDSSVTITQNDYRILRAMNGCRIKYPEFENEFKITISELGEINIECKNVDNGFQKTNTSKKNLTSIK